MHSRSLAFAAVFTALAVSAASAQQPASLPFDFSALVFGNFQMRVDSQAKFTTGGKPTSRFDLGRAYLTFRFPAGERASVRVTTDIFQQQNPAAAAYYGGWAVRLKYGYLQYDATRKLFGVQDLAATARIGMLQTVIIEHVETFWPRWLGNSPVETHGFFSSADMGAATLVTLPKRRGEIYLTVTNGPGYTANETDRFKDFAARVSITPFGQDSGLLRTFTITPWYYKGWLASAYTQATPAVSEGLQRDRRGVFVGLKDRKLTIGAEYDQRLEELETTAPPVARGALNGRTSQLVSAFALVRPAELFSAGTRSRLGLIARLDQYTPDTDLDPSTQLLVAGAIWDLTPKVSLSLDYQASTPRDNPTGVPVKAWFLHWVASF
jgi:hypothetical protein